MLAKAGPNEDPIATPSTLFLNIKNDSLVAYLKSKLRKSCLMMLGGFSLSLYKLSTQMLMVSSRGIFVNKRINV